MPNDFFNATGKPIEGSEIASDEMRDEFSSIAAGFNKLPTLTGNSYKITYINAAGSAIDVVGGNGLVVLSTTGIPTVITPGTGVATALAVNVGSAGAPVLFNGAGGTPLSLVGTNITGTAAGLTAGNVTTNANLTGHVTSVGNAAVLGSFTVAQLSAAISDANISGTNTGDQTITLTGGVTGSGTGSFAATVVTNANLTGHVTSVGNAAVLGSFTVAQLSAALSDADISGTNTGDNATNTTYASDYRAANFVAGTHYLAPNGSAASLTSFPTLNQNTNGTAANLSGTPALPNGTTATTQTAGDNSTKLATTAYADAAGKAARIQPISASVASSALTISASALSLDFRSDNIGSGTVTTVSGTPANLVISSGSTLGTVSAQQSRIVVLALNYGGTIELAAVNISGGTNLTETGVISTTAEGGAGAADSASVIYSTTARTNVAYRVIGYIESTQATAGTWATAPSTIQGAGGNAVTAMSSLGYGQTWQDLTGSRALSTTYYNTTGKPIEVSIAGNSTGALEMGLVINGVSIGLMRSYITGYTQSYTCYGTVPPGGSYSATIGGAGSSLTWWTELR